MEATTSLNISEIMQVAVTPVFLLAGIGALLNVMTSRLGRIKDRMRSIQKASFGLGDGKEKEVLEKARLKLILRSRYCYGAICFSVGSGLFVCFVRILLTHTSMI